jgi:hypothetical protein
MIGQRVVRDDDGTFLRAPEDESAARDEKKEEPEDKAESSAMAVAEKPAASPEVASLTREDSPTSTFSVVEKPHSLDASIVAQLTTDDYADLRWSRARLFKINKQIDSAQKQALPQLTNGTATGDNVRAGFIIVGRGVRSLPNAVDIPGRSKEDILWDNLGAPSGVGLFWAKVVAVGVLAAAMSLIFLGLAVASAPGVSDRLSFFESLSIRNDMGSGVVEGLVASLGITLALVGGVLLIEREYSVCYLF